MNLELQKLRQSPHLSVSQLKTFISCPRKYWLAYVEEIRPAFRPVAFALGSAWHETIGHALSQNGSGPSNGELHDHLRDALHTQIHTGDIPVLFDGREDEGGLVDLSMKMLDAFIAEVPMPEKVIGVEVVFSIDLSGSVSGESPPPLIGAVDAIVESDGKTAIWELKTARRRWSRQQLDTDLQLTGYKMAAKHLGHADAEVRLLVTTKGKEPAVQDEKVRRDERDKADFIDTALSVTRAVEAGVNYPIRSWQCPTCAYLLVCS